MRDAKEIRERMEKMEKLSKKYKSKLHQKQCECIAKLLKWVLNEDDGKNDMEEHF